MVSSQEGVVNTKEITIAITNPVPQELPLNTKEIDNQGHMAKGRRTKRQRPLSPLALTMSTSSESGFRGGSSSGLSPTSESTTTAEYKTNYGPSPVSLTSTASTEEEEDMANCLILLAQGQTQTQIENPSLSPPLPSATTNSPGKLIAATGDAAYECKTCNRRFHSFQALGGHRASHKKPKFNYPDDKIKPQFTILNEFDQFNQEGISLSLQISNKTSPITSSTRPKVHECTICGAEFSSGQALGGHMRRHRPIGGSTGAGEGRKTAALLALDLNLPAPEDEREEEFVFSSNEKRLIFSSSSLVDCHY